MSTFVTAALRARLSPFRALVTRAEALLASRLDEAFVLWSGGKDSTACVLLATAMRPDVPVVFFAGGMDYPGHVEWMRDLATSRGWNYHEIGIDPPLPEFMARQGFWDLDHASTGEPMQRFHEVANLVPARKARAMFGSTQIIGLRADESGKRSAGIAKWGLIRPFAGGIGIAPIGRWSTADVWALHALRGCPRSPVYDRLSEIGCPEIGQRVGHMVSSDALGYGRFRWLRIGWPDEWERLRKILPRIEEFS